MFLLVLIDADTYRGYSSCVSFRCTKVLDDEMYLKCPAPINVHNDADPLSLNSKDIFEEIGYRASQHWVPETDKPYICSNCGKGYTHIFTLNRHRRTVCGGGLSGQQLDDSLTPDQSGKPVFVCPKCGKGYTWKASLQRHLSTGCGLPPMFCCKLCDYRTSRKDILFRHMRHVHSRLPA
ncbi:zinc finger protein 525-like isoform X1 [Bombus affinis]|uniref:Zinc finger protein 525-like isoform X1 n=1 Tax=Bombus terrestris TaxID=30195 RepID=A0A9C6W1M5_BOMTE|nr:zinc finger protein 525-like isoform X1 [Bombus terrestris]XP_050585710.1 zinc finger protein 525-like isoform X1 [Bombus affinis]